jgi:hypothetical protein
LRCVGIFGKDAGRAGEVALTRPRLGRCGGVDNQDALGQNEAKLAHHFERLDLEPIHVGY